MDGLDTGETHSPYLSSHVAIHQPFHSLILTRFGGRFDHLQVVVDQIVDGLGSRRDDLTTTSMQPLKEFIVLLLHLSLSGAIEALTLTRHLDGGHESSV